MIVAIKSEMDSRPVLYPLMRVLDRYGSVCVISDNRQLSRLIEDEDNGGVRNIRVVVEESGGVDSVYKEYGITDTDYNFILLDNMGAMSYDVLIVPVGEMISEEFQEEVNLLKTDVNVRFIQFGKASTKDRGLKRPSDIAKRKTNSRKGELQENDIEDDPASKFKVEIDIDEEFNVSERFYACKFPTYQEIEDMESKFKLVKPGPELANAFYDIFKNQFSVDKRTYEKEIRKEDSSINGSTVRVPTDIDSNPKNNKR